LLPLLHTDQEQAVKLAQDAIAGFADLYQANWLAGISAKLGLFTREKEDETLINSLLSMMQQYQADFTNTFLALTFDRPEDTVLTGREEFSRWHELWQVRLGRQPETKAAVRQLMRSSNPAVIPRNHRVEAALEAAVKQGDYSVMNRLLEVLANPYAHTREQAEYAAPPEPSACPYQTFCGT
jgi:uncharacterized protein YdiU (UPF0061 family)